MDVTVEAVVEAATRLEKDWNVGMRYVCRNQNSEDVLRKTTEGLITATTEV